MEKTRTVLMVVMAVLLSGCGGIKSGESVKPGNGPLAPLAEKYIRMAANDDQLSEKIAEMKNADITELDKLSKEKYVRNAKLETEAKGIAETMVGKSLNCKASEATGLRDVNCSIDNVKAGIHDAVITFVFTAGEEITESYGCIFEDADGNVVRKLKTFINGDGVSVLTYKLSVMNGGESAYITSEIASVRLVTSDEYESIPVTLSSKS